MPDATPRAAARPDARVRPVADLPLEALIERAPELARRWAVALVHDRPLDGFAAIPFEALAHEGPQLCAQLLRALGSDGELDLLLGRAAAETRGQTALARRLGALVGAHDAAGIVDGIEALRGVVWEVLMGELNAAGTLNGSGVRRLADASDRLAHTCAAMLPVAMGASTDSEQKPDDVGPDEETDGAAVDVLRNAAAPGTPAAASEPIVIIDERHRDQYPADSRAPWRQPLAADTAVTEPTHPRNSEIEIRDERGGDGEGPAAWIGSIGRQLERFEQDRLAFAVLLMELSYDPGAASHTLVDVLEGALALTLRESGGGSLTRERGGRYWMLAPRTDRNGASDLAERLTVAVQAAGAAQGVRVSVALGTAVCPQDGRQASALAAHADIGLYASRSRLRSTDVAAAPASAGPTDKRA